MPLKQGMRCPTDLNLVGRVRAKSSPGIPLRNVRTAFRGLPALGEADQFRTILPARLGWS